MNTTNYLKPVPYVCKECGCEVSPEISNIFTHWEYPYMLCPKCGSVILVKIEKENKSDDKN